ncbi:hypothetical protein A2W54_00820 [Candidatus Giovannonibacteria bacterium RIFCSPHIGHO2_02_43_13]|uniref:Glycosyl transferase family 1 domain-containing protein n=1 Tax=Candidatus Giovannonibacteria bacterium RIFCSPHIGHO2_02_43_13 TaxID=1798330 RepID=A0A1F5WRX4_9BACT|nr:MAG: Glycosyl transferase group 1 [Parcubacteria group bacterium GW2011_GWA2_44_13]OGF71546.1 MAG: hypothetical protein A3E06_02265 [Candidatus Giovannonibacteria bacterium RIFCSPHIGHO2_12_FULL_44_42]OGF78408.1 MAG: hypothetical protein A2W54_00820 [Candidatus Giovannonibacteria bacterium RIFCSPHIGHO2_02_43_13]OGF97241.1 MAG: hypothetical protein A3H08_00350 [Candidatus Giovannonibacteria bacterium RIFCSPLOWO2_12_FULL_44_32]
MNKPKIYYVANARMPNEKAHGIQIAKMTEAMVLSGADLKLIVPARKAQKKSMKEFYGLEVDVPLVKIPVIDTYTYGKLGFALGSFAFMLASLIYLLWKKLAGEKFIIYVIDMDLFSFLFLPMVGRPLFAEMHDKKPASFPSKILFNRAKGIIAINKIIKQEIADTFNVSADKIIVHPNGIDLNQFAIIASSEEARKILNLPPDRRVALYSGRFYDWKGIEILLEAARLMRKEIFIYCVGGSDGDLKEIIGNDKAIPPNLICVGKKDYKEMPLWLRSADTLIVLGTKRNDYSYFHTSPMKLMEYMASGRPIIASRTPANQEIVSEKETFFYLPDDAGDLARKITEALKNLVIAGEKVESASAKVKELSWKKRADSVLHFIRDKV